MPCRSSFLCRAAAISARGLSVFRAVGLSVFRVAGILVFIPRSSLIFCSVQQLSVPCSSFLFRAAVFCSVQLFSIPCSRFLCRNRFVLMGHRTIPFAPAQKTNSLTIQVIFQLICQFNVNQFNINIPTMLDVLHFCDVPVVII